jgi:hypothetical protein
MRRPRHVIALLATVLAACASAPGQAPQLEDQPARLAQDAEVLAGKVAGGARVVGSSLGTAYHGVSRGFAEPDHADFGPYPRDYARTIHKHFLRFEGTPADASFKFGRPVKGWLNRGLLLGGGVEWQGWLVDVEVDTSSLLTGPVQERYVVRMRDGEVVEVHDEKSLGALRRE